MPYRELSGQGHRPRRVDTLVSPDRPPRARVPGRLRAYPPMWIRLGSRRSTSRERSSSGVTHWSTPIPSWAPSHSTSSCTSRLAPPVSARRTRNSGDMVEVACTPKPFAPKTEISNFVLAGDTSAQPAINSLLRAISSGTNATVIGGPGPARVRPRSLSRPDLLDRGDAGGLDLRFSL